MPCPIEFSNPDSFFKKSLQRVDDYCSWGERKVKIYSDDKIANTENYGVIQKRSTNIFLTILKIISFATIIIPLIMYGLQFALHRNFKCTIINNDTPNLNDTQKQILYKFSPNKEVWETTFEYRPEALVNFPKEVQFLKRSGLLFMSKAYESSNYTTLKDGIQFDDTDNCPRILSYGKYVRVDTLGLRYDEKTSQILDKDNVEWAFYPPQGLVKSSWRFDKNQETYKLSHEEMVTLRATAGKYNPAIPVNEQSEFIQIFTSADIEKEKPSGLTKNLGNLSFSHTGVRLIKADGSVFSLAIENKYFETTLTQGFPFNYLTSVPADVSKRDYQEIRPFGERYVTTIPIAQGKASVDQVLDELAQISASGDIRFNFPKMNCVAFADLVLKRFEVEGLPNCEMHLGKLFSTAMPWFKDEDYNAPYTRNDFQIFMENLTSRVLGMDKVHKDIDNTKNVDTLPEYWKKMWSVGRQSPGTLTDPERAEFMWSGSLSRWQKAQPSTVTFTYDKKHPRFFIVEDHKQVVDAA